MSKYLKGWLAAENGVVFLGDDPDNPLIPRIIACEDVNPIAIVWLKPVVYDGRVQGFDPIIGGTKPSDDSLKTIKVEDYNSHNVMYIAVEDTVVLDDFGTLCDTCCGTLPEFDEPDVPVPIVEEAPCPEIPAGTPLYVYDFPFPDNDNALKLSLQGSFNGAYAIPVPNPAGYANTAAVLTFAQTAVTGWAAFGTWTIVTLPSTQKLLHLESTTTITGNVVIGLVPASYCLDIPTPAVEIDSIVIDGVTTTFPPVMLDRANPNAALFAIRPYLIGTLETVVSGGHNKFQYTGLQLPTDLKDGVTVRASFGAGLCP